MKSYKLVALSAALAALGYVRARRPIRTWGATEAEADGALPGDELLPDADGVTTRAIDIHAPPAHVWPWLAQMGPSPRGGAYTYDWIENLLGLNMHSVDRVLPEFQDPQVGDKIDLGASQMELGSSRAETCPRVASSGRELGVDVRAREAGRTNEIDKSKPLPHTFAAWTDSDAADGTRISRDGAAHAARDQAPGRGAPHGVVAACSVCLRATTTPACQPGARPPRGGRIASTSIPLLAITHAITAFEFHISPAASSSRPQTGVGTRGTVASTRRALSSSLLSRTGLSTASETSGMWPPRQTRIS